tara:strand:- start:6614 stop:8104 length:1491 start_codon:yes stop_codon:yes gene_type:complete
MDEEQTLASPLAGSIRGIRRSVSSNVFRPRVFNQQPQQDQKTTSLLTENSLSLQRVSNQLESITTQVSALGKSLVGIRENLAISDQIDRNRERERQKREAILAEQGLREGKEGEIEKKIQRALLSPVRTIAKKAQGILSRIGTFLLTIAGGWLTDKVLRFFSLKTEGNAEAMKKFKIEFLSNLLFFGGTLALFKVGLGKILLGVKNIGQIVLKIGVSGLLTRGFKSAINFVRNTLSIFKNFILGGGRFFAGNIAKSKAFANQLTLGGIGVEIGKGPLSRIGRFFGRFGLGLSKTQMNTLKKVPIIGTIVNTLLFAGEYVDRKSEGQTNTQAAAGAAANVAGYAASFALGSAIGTFLFPGAGTILGGLIGGSIGFILSSGLFGMSGIPKIFSDITDKITGVDKSKKNKSNNNVEGTNTSAEFDFQGINNNGNKAENISNLIDNPNLQFINLAQDNSGAMKEFASSSSIDIQQILNISAEDNTNLFTTFAESEFNLPN